MNDELNTHTQNQITIFEPKPLDIPEKKEVHIHAENHHLDDIESLTLPHQTLKPQKQNYTPWHRSLTFLHVVILFLLSLHLLVYTIYIQPTTRSQLYNQYTTLAQNRIAYITSQFELFSSSISEIKSQTTVPWDECTETAKITLAQEKDLNSLASQFNSNSYNSQSALTAGVLFDPQIDSYAEKVDMIVDNAQSLLMRNSVVFSIISSSNTIKTRMIQLCNKIQNETLQFASQNKTPIAIETECKSISQERASLENLSNTLFASQPSPIQTLTNSPLTFCSLYSPSISQNQIDTVSTQDLQKEYNTIMSVEINYQSTIEGIKEVEKNTISQIEDVNKEVKNYHSNRQGFQNIVQLLRIRF